MQTNTACAAGHEALLDQMQRRADPLADAAIASVLGPWRRYGEAATAAEVLSAPQWERIATLQRCLDAWQCNRDLVDRPAADVPPPIAEALAAYTQAACELPTWADPPRIRRAEVLFLEHGALACTLLFCASLPEVYVIPDLSAVLNATGQLEQHTEGRIRATASMIFPIILEGGLSAPDGAGIAQALKVRLVHALVRNLILRGSPQVAPTAGAEVPPLPGARMAGNMLLDVFAHGWQEAGDGQPCNQEEMAYTLLTFGYVVLRSLRKLGLGLCRADEEALLHTWNVVGHLLGVERELMADTMEHAERLFEHMQARGRATPPRPDPRPALGHALMAAMERSMTVTLVRPFAVLMTRHLCGAATARDLGIMSRVSLWARASFALCVPAIRGADAIARRLWPGFSIARWCVRMLGYRFLIARLTDPAHPLKLPPQVMQRAHAVIDSWSRDMHAPAWMNAAEAYFAARWGLLNSAGP